MHRIAPRLAAAAVVLACYLLGASNAHACDCFSYPTCANLWNTDLVFVGRVERIETPSPGYEEATLIIEDWLRGKEIKTSVTIASRGVGVSCEYDFSEGRRYLVFAYQTADGTWKAALCGGTKPLDNAKKEVDEIKRDLRSRAPGRVSGQVAFDEKPGEFVFPDTPIPAAEVRLQNPQRVLTAKTNSRGEFQFSRVPPGQYSLVATLPAEAERVPPIPVLVGANACITRGIYPERAK